MVSWIFYNDVLNALQWYLACVMMKSWMFYSDILNGILHVYKRYPECYLKVSWIFKTISWWIQISISNKLIHIPILIHLKKNCWYCCFRKFPSYCLSEFRNFPDFRNFKYIYEEDFVLALCLCLAGKSVQCTTYTSPTCQVKLDGKTISFLYSRKWGNICYTRYRRTKGQHSAPFTFRTRSLKGIVS